VTLAGEQRDDRCGDVVDAAPVGGLLGIGELVHEAPAGRVGDPLGLGADQRGIVHEPACAAVVLDQRDLLGAGRGRHDGHEREAQQRREVRLGDRGGAAGGLADRGLIADQPLQRP